MSIIKQLGRSQGLRSALCWLGAQYVKLVHLTSRWRIDGKDKVDRLVNGNQPIIVAFWHGHLLMMPKVWLYPIPFHMLISQHRDGELIARTVAHFGIQWVAGSTTRGGSSALRSMLKSLKAGECVGITPDGPHGPATQASDGIIAVARLSGCPVVAGTWSTSRQIKLKTWDRFRIPLPFSRGVFVWGDPIFIPKDADEAQLETCRQQVEDSLNGITLQADRAVGIAP